jgi:hypothetical protein
LLQCLKIADLIADESSGLSEVLRQDKATLRALLVCIRTAALKNLQLGHNALGTA